MSAGRSYQQGLAEFLAAEPNIADPDLERLEAEWLELLPLWLEASLEGEPELYAYLDERMRQVRALRRYQ